MLDEVVNKNTSHPLFCKLLPCHVTVRITRAFVVAHPVFVTGKSQLFQRSSLARCVSDWNRLNISVSDGEGSRAL